MTEFSLLELFYTCICTSTISGYLFQARQTLQHELFEGHCGVDRDLWQSDLLLTDNKVNMTGHCANGEHMGQLRRDRPKS